MTALLNDAFRTLREPIQRAEYFCREKGLEPSKNPPQDLLSTLTRSFDRIGVVERAFVAEAYKPSMGDSPQYLVVVKFHEGSVATLDDFMEKLKPVLDAVNMSHSVLFGDWKSNGHTIREGTEPFYVRQEAGSAPSGSTP